MQWSEQIARFAQYNQWINNQLLETCASLSPEAALQDRGVFFDSIIGTWNHLLVTDILWLYRLKHLTTRFDALSGLPTPTTLNQVIAAQINEVHQTRTLLDGMLISWCADLSPDDSDVMVAYKNIAGIPHEHSLGTILQHMFNHQTHHRGQITALLSQAGVSYGCTDMLYAPLDIEANTSG